MNYPDIIEINENKYYRCPECSGSGQLLSIRPTPSGPQEYYEICEFEDVCDRGYISEDEYIVLKIRGYM